MKTKEKLAEDLRKANAPDDMVQRALQGYYDDYESPLATPIHRLVNDAIEWGLMDIANKARNGDYDGTKEESEAWLNSNPEMKDIIDSFNL